MPTHCGPAWLLALAFVSACRAAPTAAPTPAATNATPKPIADQDEPTALPEGLLLVADKAEAKLRVIEMPERTLVATLATGQAPHEVAVSDDDRLAVVSNYGAQVPGHTLTVVDLEAMKVVRTIDLGEHARPHGSRFVPGTHELVVTTEVSQHVVRVDVDAGAILAAIPTEQPASHMVVLAPDGRRAYTTNVQTGTVSELDLQSGAHVRTIPARPISEAIAITPDGASLWVGSNAEHTVSVLDTTSGEITATMTTPGVPIRVEIDPQGSRAVVTAAEGGRVYVFDVATREQVAAIELPVGERVFGPGPADSPVPVGIAIPTRAHAFVSLARTGEVAILDLERGTIIERLPVGQHPDGIAFVPTGT
jgi:DNA-binding beta-propeller fold protein YncE